MKTAKDILDRTANLVSGDREKQHGAKEKNLENIAELWSTYLDEPIYEKDVCNMMMLLKIARSQTGEFNSDNYVDICGYASIAGELGLKNEKLLKKKKKNKPQHRETYVSTQEEIKHRETYVPSQAELDKEQKDTGEIINEAVKSIENFAFYEGLVSRKFNPATGDYDLVDTHIPKVAIATKEEDWR